MKILGIELGKKGERIINIELAKKETKETIKETNEIIKEKNICFEPYSRYKNFIKQITNEGWSLVGDLQTNNRDIVSFYYVEKGMYGTFLEISCPSPLYQITICGFDDAGIEPIKFYSHPNLYKIPHFFSITCTDNNGRELSSDINIDIIKMKGIEPKRLCSEPYGDLSRHIDGRFRRKEERYYFYESIKLENHERLSFRVNSPDIDITKTILSMKGDIFAKEI